LALMEANSANMRRRVAEVATATASANARLEELARSEQHLRARLGESLQNLTARRDETRQLGDTMLEVGTRLEARRAALHALEQELGHRRRLVDELEAQIVQLRAELARAQSDRAEFEREMAGLVAQDSAALEGKLELEHQVEELTLACSERILEVEGAATRLSSARAALATLQAEVMHC